jgi:hypothetical protein
MALGDGLDQGQPQPCATTRFGYTGKPVKGFEHTLLVFHWDAGSLVHYRNAHHRRTFQMRRPQLKNHAKGRVVAIGCTAMA